MSDLLNIPHFENEEQEANWWFENSDKVESAFVQAEKEGRLSRGSNAVTAALRRKGEGVLSVRMSEQDLVAIHELASKEGQDDEACAAVLLHEALQARKEEPRQDLSK